MITETKVDVSDVVPQNNAQGKSVCRRDHFVAYLLLNRNHSVPRYRDGCRWCYQRGATALSSRRRIARNMTNMTPHRTKCNRRLTIAKPGKSRTWAIASAIKRQGLGRDAAGAPNQSKRAEASQTHAFLLHLQPRPPQSHELQLFLARQTQQEGQRTSRCRSRLDQ